MSRQGHFLSDCLHMHMHIQTVWQNSAVSTNSRSRLPGSSKSTSSVCLASQILARSSDLFIRISIRQWLRFLVLVTESQLFALWQTCEFSDLSDVSNHFSCSSLCNPRTICKHARSHSSCTLLPKSCISKQQTGPSSCPVQCYFPVTW